jgi:L-alanine-DL-glutamate epimerase-like enolase superfamily enzyme
VTVRQTEWGGAIPRVANARLAWTERRGVLLMVEADGVTGYGEATPLPGYGGGTLEQAWEALRTAPIPELLGLQTREDVEAAIRTEVPSARFCLESALLDRLARVRGAPLADFLSDREIGKPVPRARFGGNLGEATVVDERPLKLKVTGDQREAGWLQELRERHPNLELRLDLNGALDLESARRALDVYARFGVRWVEEPVAGKALLQLGRGPVPWLADESLVDPLLADELVSSDACGGVVLKPTLLGLGRARALAERALAHGKVAVVSHAFEGPVALAACAELALSLGLQHACGIDRHAALSAFPPAHLAQLPEDGEIEPIPRAGLGLTWR